MLLTFGLSWMGWAPLVAASRGYISPAVPPSATALMGAFGPTLIALGLTWFSEGGGGVRRLLCRLLRWRVHPGWYACTLLAPAAISLVGTLLWVLLGHGMVDFSHPQFVDEYPLPEELRTAVTPWAFLPLVLIQYLLVGSPMGEEIGWRGYALPRLQARLTALTSSLLIGVIWGLWHLPLALTRGNHLSETFFGWFMLGIVADAVLFTWVYNSTGGSLLLVLLLHGSIAVTGLFLTPADAPPWLDPALKWILVGAVIAVVGGSNLSRAGRQQVPD